MLVVQFQKRSGEGVNELYDFHLLCHGNGQMYV